MCNFGSSSNSAPTIQNTTQGGNQTVTALPGVAEGYYNPAGSIAMSAAYRQFQPYSSDPSSFVAQLNQDQLQSIWDLRQAQNTAQPAYQAALGMAAGAGGQNVSDFNIAEKSQPYYNTAAQYTQQAATAPGGYQAANPYLTSGFGLAQQASQLTTPVGQQQIQSFMSPYLKDVADPTMAFLKQQQEQAMAGQTGQAIQQGAFGGDRAGIAAATLAAQQEMSSGKTYGDIMQQGYGQALNAAFQSQQASQADRARQLAASQAMGQFGSTAGQLQQADLSRLLQAGDQYANIGTLGRQAYEQQQTQQQADLTRKLQAAQLMGGLGAGAQTAQIQAAQALMGAGGTEQQTAQAGLQALYNQYLMSQAFPFQVGQYAANIASQLGPLYGQTQSTNQYGSQTQQVPLSFFGTTLAASGGAINGSEERLGGGVTGSGDYARGGFADGGTGQSSQYDPSEGLYGGIGYLNIKPTKASNVPTMAAMSPLPFSSPTSSGKSGLSALSDLYGQGKSALGELKGLDSLTGGKLSGLASDAAKSANLGQGMFSIPGVIGDSGAAGATSAGLGDSLMAGLGSAASAGSGLLSSIGEGLAALGPLLLLKDGGSVPRAAYKDGGPDDDVSDDDIFEKGLLGAESGRSQFDKKGRVLTSPKGAEGIAQIMPSTAPEAAKLAGLEYDPERVRSDEGYNKALGKAYYDAQLKRFGTPELALAAYNAGPGRVQKALDKAGPGGDVMSLLPQETRDYVPKALGLAGAGMPDLSEMTPEQLSMMATTVKGAGISPPSSATEAPQQGEGISGFLRGTAPEGVGEKALDFLTSERFIVPLLSGLGAMSESKSRFFAPALLKGLGAGAASYMEVPKISAETKKIGQEALKTAEEAAKTRAETGEVGARTGKLGAEQKFVEAETKKALSELYEKKWIPNVGWTINRKDDPNQIPTPISDVEGRPLSNAPHPNEVPTAVGGEKPIEAPPTEVKPIGKDQIGSAANWKATTDIPSTMQPPTGAYNIAMTPGALEKEIESSKTEVDKQRALANASYNQLYRIDEMENQSKNIPSEGWLEWGPYAAQRTQIAKDINGIVAMIGGKPLFDPSNVAAAETLAKDTTRLGFATAQGLGHEPGFIVERSIAANPGMENTQLGFQRITAGLKEAAKYEQDKLTFMEKYAAKYQTIKGAENAFRELNPPQKYADRAILSTVNPRAIEDLRKFGPNGKYSNGQTVREYIDKNFGNGITDKLMGR